MLSVIHMHSLMIRGKNVCFIYFFAVLHDTWVFRLMSFEL